MLTELIEIENQIINVERKLKRKSNSKRLKAKLNLLLKNSRLHCTAHLLLTKGQFREVHEENLSFIANRQLIFKSSKFSFQDSKEVQFPSMIKGSLRKNGHLYSSVSKMGYAFDNITKHLRVLLLQRIYPKRYVGEINVFGELFLKASEFGYSYGGRAIRTMKVSTDEFGKIQTSVSENQYTKYTREYASQFICDVFHGRDDLRERFHANKIWLQQEVITLRMNELRN